MVWLSDGEMVHIAIELDGPTHKAWFTHFRSVHESLEWKAEEHRFQVKIPVAHYMVG